MSFSAEAAALFPSGSSNRNGSGNAPATSCTERWHGTSPHLQAQATASCGRTLRHQGHSCESACDGSSRTMRAKKKKKKKENEKWDGKSNFITGPPGNSGVFRFLLFLGKPQLVSFLRFRFRFFSSSSVCCHPVIHSPAAASNEGVWER